MIRHGPQGMAANVMARPARHGPQLTDDCLSKLLAIAHDSLLANVCYTRAAAVGGVVALGHVATAHVEDQNAPLLRARGMGSRALTPHTSSNGVSATGDGWSDTWNTMTSADAWR